MKRLWLLSGWHLDKIKTQIGALSDMLFVKPANASTYMNVCNTFSAERDVRRAKNRPLWGNSNTSFHEFFSVCLRLPTSAHPITLPSITGAVAVLFDLAFSS